MGVVAPNGISVKNFTQAIQKGKSGIAFQPEMEELNFRCHVAGIPDLSEADINSFSKQYKLRKLMSSGILYGTMASMEAWKDAGLPIPDKKESPDWESGCIFGSGMTGIEPMDFSIRHIDEGIVRKIGGRIVQQGMSSGPSAYIGGLLGLGNQVTSNASACATGTESLLMAFNRIQLGLANRMLVGGCDSASRYIWGGFDAMRVLSNQSNDSPENASRPMSSTANGFVPGAGAGALVLEELETAQKRGAPIYAELLGGAINCGGQRQGGSMTAPNTAGVVKCIQLALQKSQIKEQEVDAVCGHLTSTLADPLEVQSIAIALNRKNGDFPYINSLKSMIGHCLSAAGAIECIALIKQLKEGFFHASLNCEDLHPDIHRLVDPTKIPNQTIQDTPFNVMLKTSFGFGDVNCCAVFKKWNA